MRCIGTFRGAKGYGLEAQSSTMEWGTKRMPDGKVTGLTTFKERQTRAALGEGAIALFERLGVTPEKLAELVASPDPLVALTEMQEGK